MSNHEEQRQLETHLETCDGGVVAKHTCGYDVLCVIDDPELVGLQRGRRGLGNR